MESSGDLVPIIRVAGSHSYLDPWFVKLADISVNTGTLTLLDLWSHTKWHPRVLAEECRFEGVCLLDDRGAIDDSDLVCTVPPSSRAYCRS